MMQYREKLLDFLNEVVPNYTGLTMVAGDASFRKYYRVTHLGINYILMDAPPSDEDASLFMQIAIAFSQAGINVPEIIESDFDNGFLLLSDFGDVQLQPLLERGQLEIMDKVLNELFVLQKQGGQAILELPEYNHELLLRELSLFPLWFVNELLGTKLNDDEEELIVSLNKLLISSALQQRQTWVHRDYHSRNLMLTSDNRIGVIDFQDAVFGPITYDLASILKDCYIRYEDKDIEQYLQKYFIKLVSAEMIYCDFDQFVKWFDLMAMQRHMKVLGIFARLSIRDKKDGYLNDLPLVFDYVQETLNKYPELEPYRDTFNKLRLKMDEKLNERLVKK